MIESRNRLIAAACVAVSVLGGVALREGIHQGRAFDDKMAHCGTLVAERGLAGAGVLECYEAIDENDPLAAAAYEVGGLLTIAFGIGGAGVASTRRAPTMRQKSSAAPIA